MAIFNNNKKETSAANVWARPEMLITFKAEVMPGRTREERTFRIKSVRSNGRVALHGFTGEHREGAFEPLNFLRNTVK